MVNISPVYFTNKHITGNFQDFRYDLLGHICFKMGTHGSEKRKKPPPLKFCCVFLPLRIKKYDKKSLLILQLSEGHLFWESLLIILSQFRNLTNARLGNAFHCF